MANKCANCGKEENWLDPDFIRQKSTGLFYCPNCAEIIRSQQKQNQDQDHNSEISKSGQEIYILLKDMNQNLVSIKTTLDFFKVLVIILLVFSFITAISNLFL